MEAMDRELNLGIRIAVAKAIRSLPLWTITCVIIALACPLASGDILFYDTFSSDVSEFMENWTIIETGDEQMTWYLGSSRLSAHNEIEGGGNNQSIIFGTPISTAGYESIYVSIIYSANNEDDFESGDFIRIVGYDKSPLEGGLPTIENTTEGLWSPGSKPPTSDTVFDAYYDSYSNNNSFWVAIEINTSLPREIISVNSISVSGELIPEPATLSLLALGGLALRGRSRRIA